ncbi:Polypeptide-transport-associated protein domain protein, FtsQ-type [Alkaliphilus metalliredigens QYMF]|uniref:Polypeptide-transport-associated protein domain protein, FtsQ-type n=1 Tax=Alkaliphilus metalliredigens (strain QYMF) TaxID=293826 RepID=A6TS59_ALKMQ|nr:FtsQ-type POTRA domain-containing protein [Alkaliphilus metalliredigens]ABR49027.1 Polypeptide-transport-associated protein domain protein, FtsQ-type [Alkaliphilus metalliredigens QYMF]
MPINEGYRKKRVVRRKLKRTLTSILFAIIIILSGIYYILQSDLMNLKHVEVQGQNEINFEEIIEASQLVYNRNLLKYNLETIEKNITAHPYISETQVKRSFPNTMKIHVKEREEYAIITYMGSYIYIDENTVILKAIDSYLADDLTIITGIELKNFKVGEIIETHNDEQLEIALGLLRAARETTIYDMISEVNISEPNEVNLITFDGITVLLGNVRDPGYSMVALDEVLVELYTRGIRSATVDMRYEGHISVKDQREQGDEE